MFQKQFIAYSQIWIVKKLAGLQAVQDKKDLLKKLVFLLWFKKVTVL